MIAFLEGLLTEKENGFVVLNVNGVGYRVEISLQTYENLPAAGAGIRLLIHHHITDSDQRLFGFFSAREQRLFEKLITVKGVGPKLGLTIMSGMQAPMLVESIIQKDQQGLSRIPGIGKKTAERIILELKDKILDSDGPEEKMHAGKFSKRDEAISALQALGFRKQEAEKAVMNITGMDDRAEVPDIVRKALMQKSK